MIALDPPVVRTLRRLTDALAHPVVLVGGWGVQCRLRLARRPTRVTADLDVVLPAGARPAREALAAAAASQTDRAHPCRLTGFEVAVDLLAEGPGPDHFVDDDGLCLLVPPFADALTAAADALDLVADDEKVGVVVPRAGALFATKVANFFLESRAPAKRATDGYDALALLDAFGPRALAHDLIALPAARRARLADMVDQLGYGGLAAQARMAGGAFPAAQDTLPVLVATLVGE